MTLMTVAKIAGVSHTTVSRVINNDPAVSPQTAQQVRRAIDELGYVPPANRRGPRSRPRRGIHNRCIAVLVSNRLIDDSGHPIISSLLEHVEVALREAGLSLMFSRISDNQPPPAIVRDRLVDGLLLYGRPLKQAHLISQLGAFPCVWMLTKQDDLPISCDWVQPDNVAMGRLAATYLAERKHRHLAMISSRPHDVAVRDRVRGFLAATPQGLTAHDLTEAEYPEVTTSPGYEHDLEPIRHRIDRMMALPRRPTGLFVPNPELAALCYRVLADRGVRPGQDFELVCCNRNPLLLGLDPVPAVVDIRPDLIGQRAVEQLLWRMENPHNASTVLVSITPRLLKPDDLRKETSARPSSPAADRGAVASRKSKRSPRLTPSSAS